MKYLAIIVTIALFSAMGYLIWDQRNQSTQLKNELELLRRQQNPSALNERELEIAKLESQLLAQQQQLQQQQPQQAPQTTTLPTPAPNANSLPPLNPPPAAAAPAPASAPAPAPTVAQQTPAQAPAPAPAPAQESLPPLNPPPATMGTAETANPAAPVPAFTTPPTTPEPPPLTPRQNQILAAPLVGKVTEYHKDYGFVMLQATPGLQIENNMTFAIRREHNIIGRVKITSSEEGSFIADILSGSVPAGVTIQVGDDIIQDLP